MSTVKFKTSDLNLIGRLMLTVCKYLRIAMVTEDDDDEWITMNNLTLINFIIYIFGPMHEQTITVTLLIIQVLCFPHLTPP